MPTIDDAKLLEEIQRMRAALRSRRRIDLIMLPMDIDLSPGARNCVDEPSREIYFMDFFRSFWRRLTRRLRA